MTPRLPSLHRRLFHFVAPMPLACLLCATPLAGQAAGPQVPVRGLVTERIEAEQGTAAIVHTWFSTGYGFVLDGKQEVVVARHSVLTPDGKIAGDIGVKFPQQPLNNFVESQSVAVAQDPVHDLVLLRLVGTTQGAGAAARMSSAPARAAGKAPGAAVPVALKQPAASPLAAVAPCNSQAHMLRASEQASRAARLRKAAGARRAPRHNLRQLLAFSRNPRLHIVWDGPATGSRY